MPATEPDARKKLKKSSKDKLKFALTPLIALLIFGIDFAIKTYLRLNFAYQSFPLIENIVSITVIFNTGTAFGLLQGRVTLLIYLSLILILLLLFIFKLEKKKKLIFRIATGLIFGGAISNLVDRLMLQAVIDYIDLGFWPVFNLSDACITIGAALLIIDSFRRQTSK